MSEKKMNEKEKEIMWWECPECGWCPSDITDMDSPELFYYVENNKAIPIKEGWIEVRNENKGSLTSTIKKMDRVPDISKAFYMKDSRGYKEYKKRVKDIE